MGLGGLLHGHGLVRAQPEPAAGSYQPLINGSDTVTSTPYVLTAGQVGGVLATTEVYLAAGSIAPSQMCAGRARVHRGDGYLEAVVERDDIAGCQALDDAAAPLGNSQAAQ